MTHRRRQHFYALPRGHQALLSAPPFSILETLSNIDDAIDTNADIADSILASGLEAFGIDGDGTDNDESTVTFPWHGMATPADIDKARSTLRQLYRDWSGEGACERSAHYEPLLADLRRLFPLRFQAMRGSSVATLESVAPDIMEARSKALAARGDIRVLVPGAGLGRLVFEICRLGFAAEGNELAFHALLAGHWALNGLAIGQTHDLYPFAFAFANQVSRERQLRAVQVPDRHPGQTLATVAAECEGWAGSMSMSAAEFVLLYASEEHAGRYDAVVTSFFVDTAPNVVRYVETIWHTLKEGGYWLNLGPLLWHFGEKEAPTLDRNGSGCSRNKQPKRQDEGTGEPGSVELTADELLLLVEQLGFTIEMKEVEDSGCGYIQDPDCMLQNTYKVLHFTARKIPAH